MDLVHIMHQERMRAKRVENVQTRAVFNKTFKTGRNLGRAGILVPLRDQVSGEYVR